LHCKRGNMSNPNTTTHTHTHFAHTHTLCSQWLLELHIHNLSENNRGPPPLLSQCMWHCFALADRNMQILKHTVPFTIGGVRGHNPLPPELNPLRVLKVHRHWPSSLCRGRRSVSQVRSGSSFVAAPLGERSFPYCNFKKVWPRQTKQNNYLRPVDSPSLAFFYKPVSRSHSPSQGVIRRTTSCRTGWLRRTLFLAHLYKNPHKKN